MNNPPMATSQSDPKPIISGLSPELSTVLRNQTETILRYLVDGNSATVYFREAPLLSELRTALQRTTRLTPGDVCDEGNDAAPLDVCKAFTKSVPLSTYEDYRPFITRFKESPILLSDVSNLLAPGIPAFIVSSSGTSGAAKLFLKYNRPLPTSLNTKSIGLNMLPNSEEGTYCAIFNLRHSEVLDVVKNCDGGESEIINQIPICFVSSAMIRLSRGWNIDQDPALQKTKIPNCTSPLAIYFIHSHQSSLLMHALFALADNSLEKFSTIFSTTFVDLMRVIEKNWDILIHAIATGEVPRSDGIESLYYDCIQLHLTANPHRAEQLRAVGNDTTSPGWAKKLWPNLKLVVANSSGRLSAVVPQARHYIGGTVILQSSSLASSEAWFGTPYDPTQDLNLYNMVTREYFEYLDISVPESAVNLKQPWEVEVGKYYELVMTTRDGLWRYRLGDILLVVGFNPTDGQPIVRYSSRRNVTMRASGESVTEKELTDAIHSIRDILGDVAEYTVVVDYRQTPRAYGFLVELRGEPGIHSRSVMSHLDDFLHSISTSYAHYRSSGHIGVPTIRLLSPGTFGSYREWKAQGNVLGSGPTKVPTVTLDEHAIFWLMDKVVQEILL